MRPHWSSEFKRLKRVRIAKINSYWVPKHYFSFRGKWDRKCITHTTDNVPVIIFSSVFGSDVVIGSVWIYDLHRTRYLHGNRCSGMRADSRWLGWERDPIANNFASILHRSIGVKGFLNYLEQSCTCTNIS